MIRTRFAPSPTGHLHIGGARTALFNWLYARKNNGKFILRIEDTDKERSTANAVNAIIEGMTWLGLDWDEGPTVFKPSVNKPVLSENTLLQETEEGKNYYQSNRLEIYKKYYSQLLENNSAFEKEGAVYIKGDPKKNIDDFVIIKSDGNPVYNFAVVIDDALMEITHVIRGDDHVSNTPRQIHIYQALQLKIPKFIHVPMILGSDGKRLSKRHGATSITEFQEQGYLPDAMVNYLARLGWSSGNQEFFTRKELIEKFSINKLGKSAAIFNKEKLDWINAEHIKQASAEQLKDYLPEKYHSLPRLSEMINLVKSRTKTINELNKVLKYFIKDTIEYDSEAKTVLLTEKNITLLKALYQELEPLTVWQAKTIENTVRTFAQTHALNAGDIIHPLRVALTGSKVSPSIFEVLELMPKELIKKRLNSI